MNIKDNNDDVKMIELRSNYWLKRLDHTLTHTQSSSRLIYIVDGAVLALLYFLILNIQPTRTIVLFAAIPTFLLSILNFLHARLITVQRSWYAGIDDQLRVLLSQEQIRPKKTRKFFASTHGIYEVIHYVICSFLVIAGIVMLLYGFMGLFSEIKVNIPQSSLYLQEKCSDGAKTFVTRFDAVESYNSHYNKKLDGCFIRAGFYLGQKKESEEFGDGKNRVVQHPHWMANLYNVFDIKMIGSCAYVGKETQECWVGNTKCKTIDEFENLIRPYMEE